MSQQLGYNTLSFGWIPSSQNQEIITSILSGNSGPIAVGSDLLMNNDSTISWTGGDTYLDSENVESQTGKFDFLYEKTPGHKIWVEDQMDFYAGAVAVAGQTITTNQLDATSGGTINSGSNITTTGNVKAAELLSNSLNSTTGSTISSTSNLVSTGYAQFPTVYTQALAPLTLSAAIAVEAGQIFATDYLESTSVGRIICPSVIDSEAGLVSGPNQYNVGTCSTSGSSTSVSGVGTTWTSSMVGGILYISTSSYGYITAVGSTTSLTVAIAMNVPALSNYLIYYDSVALQGTFGTIPNLTVNNVASSNGLINLNSILSASSIAGFINNSSTYSTGTITTTGSTFVLNGSGTTWTSAMCFGIIVISGTVYYIEGFYSATSIGLNANVNISSPTTYVIYYGGAQIGAGNASFLNAKADFMWVDNITSKSAQNSETGLELIAIQSLMYIGNGYVGGNYLQYNTGTCSTSGFSTTITGSGTSWTSAMVGGLFCSAAGGGSAPSMYILAVNVGAQTLTLAYGLTLSAGTVYNIYWGTSVSTLTNNTFQQLMLPVLNSAGFDAVGLYLDSSNNVVSFPTDPDLCIKFFDDFSSPWGANLTSTTAAIYSDKGLWTITGNGATAITNLTYSADSGVNTSSSSGSGYGQLSLTIAHVAGTTGIGLSPNFYLNPNAANIIFEIRVLITNTAESMNAQFGIIQQGTTQVGEVPANDNTTTYCCMGYDKAIFPNDFQAYSRTSGSGARTSTNIAVDNNFHIFKMVISTTQVHFYVDGVNTNLQSFTPASAFYQPFVSFQQISTANDTGIVVDYVKLYSQVAAR